MRLQSFHLSFFICLILFSNQTIVAGNSYLPKIYKLSLIEATLLDFAWGNWSLPIGKGYFGANIFGRTRSTVIAENYLITLSGSMKCLGLLSKVSLK